MILIHQKVE